MNVGGMSVGPTSAFYSRPPPLVAPPGMKFNDTLSPQTGLHFWPKTWNNGSSEANLGVSTVVARGYPSFALISQLPEAAVMAARLHTHVHVS